MRMYCYFNTVISARLFNVFSKVIYSCDVKAEFSASLLQSSVSHDPSEIILICWFAAQDTFTIINVKYRYQVLFSETFIKNYVSLWFKQDKMQGQKNNLNSKGKQEINKIHTDWSDIRVSKLCQNCLFCMNFPFNICFFTDLEAADQLLCDSIGLTRSGRSRSVWKVSNISTRHFILVCILAYSSSCNFSALLIWVTFFKHGFIN